MANKKRLIDANALKGDFMFLRKMWSSTEVMAMIDEAPTVDAVPVVHGRWLSAYEYAQKLGVTDKEKLEEVKADKWWKFCNHCDQQVKGFHNYCNNCGADMRERRTDV